MKKTLFVSILTLMSVLPAFTAGSREEGVSFVTTTSIVNDVVLKIAGDDVEIYSLIAKGQDPHGYEPTPRDMARVEKADIVFVNGFDLEENLLSVLETVHTGRIVEVSSRVNAIEGHDHDHDEHDADEDHDHDGHDHEADDDHDHDGHDHEADDDHDHDGHDHEADDDHDHDDHDADDDHAGHSHDGDDPHTWMSPLNVLTWVDVIEKTLTEALPEKAEVFSANAEAYRAELKALDGWIQSELKVLPSEKRVLVTDHNVFGYFARDYGFEVVGTIIPGFSSSAEPSAGDISRLIGVLEAENVSALFVGESAGEGTRKLADTLSREAEQPVGVYEVLT
ncbi:MAG: metal ABC transporter substrate-binding protein, partial [Spirochaetales bacterium]|nr:metal ABC transporter substrate-binding protein [Spirochaetales bacterium]